MKRGSAGKGRVPILVCVMLIIVLTLALALLCAKLILSGMIDESEVKYCGGIISAIVAMFVALITAKRSPRKKALWGLVASAGYMLILLLGNLLFFGTTFSGVLLIAGCVFAGGALGSLLGCKKVRKYA